MCVCVPALARPQNPGRRFSYVVLTRNMHAPILDDFASKYLLAWPSKRMTVTERNTQKLAAGQQRSTVGAKRGASLPRRRRRGAPAARALPASRDDVAPPGCDAGPPVTRLVHHASRTLLLGSSSSSSLTADEERRHSTTRPHAKRCRRLTLPPRRARGGILSCVHMRTKQS